MRPLPSSNSFWFPVILFPSQYHNFFSTAINNSQNTVSATHVFMVPCPSTRV